MVVYDNNICGILGSTIPLFIYTPRPSDALDNIAQRLISTQAVRDSKDRHAVHERSAPLPH
jgi:hypothetical protein